MKIYLIRHGQTTGDVEDRYGGWYDDSLTNKGKTQVKKLARKLKHEQIEIIFSSSLKRAKETAKIISKRLGAEVRIVKNIREQNHYGILSGLTRKQAKERYPEEVEKLRNYKTTIHGGESYAAFKRRVLKTFAKITSMKYDRLAIVTHGGPIKCILRKIRNKEHIREIHDCEAIIISKDKNRVRIAKTIGP